MEYEFLKNAALTGMVQEFAWDKFTAINEFFVRTDTDVDFFEFEVLEGSKGIASFRNPDAPANVSDNTIRKRVTVKLRNLREKRRIKESTIRLLDAPGRKGFKEKAATKIARELQDIDNVIMRTWEKYAWDCVTTGTLTLPEHGVDQSYDFGLTNTVDLTGDALWSAAATATPLANLLSWSELVTRGAGEQATDVYMTSVAFRHLMASAEVVAKVDDDSKKEFLRTGKLVDIANLTIHLIDWGFDNAGTFNYFLGGETGNKVIVKAPGPVGFFVDGPAMDSKAPDGLTGKFSKSWEQEDPTGRWLLECHQGIPGLTEPDRLYTATVLA